MIAAEGEKAVAFSAVARATGLAGASLVQRYGPLPQMVEQALSWGWDALDAVATAAEAEGAEPSSAKAGKALQKGPQALLKALSDKAEGVPMAALLAASLRHVRLRARAADWRDRVEALLATRTQDRDSAAMIFAAWQGQVLWQGLGDKDFRLKDMLKKLG